MLREGKDINVQEMGKFVDLAKRLNANDVWFTRIQNWGTYNGEEFEQIDVMDEQDNIKEEYQEYFDDPVLKSNDVHFSALLTGEDADFQITSEVIDTAQWHIRVDSVREEFVGSYEENNPGCPEEF